MIPGLDLAPRQRGRAELDFMVALGRAAGPLAARGARALAAAGLSPQHFPADFDAGDRAVAEVRRTTPAMQVSALALEFASREHGRVATRAFDALAPDLAGDLARLDEGPATLERRPGFRPPDYHAGVWFHRTEGGWEGHPEQGLIHGEFIHRHYVARLFPGDIFAQRRAVLSLLPRGDYRDILDMGASSGHFTLALAETFPQARITGIDPSVAMLRHARRTANARGLPWRLIEGVAEATGLPDRGFDVVASYILLHEVPAHATRAIFAEAFRLLRPGGHMLMSDVTPCRALDPMAAWRADWQARQGGEPWWREAASLDLGLLARETGFVDVASEGLNGVPYPWVTLGTRPA